ncbi:MAG: hypothetical protein QOG32_486, partial [Chloroflexota bacterium]|nr:hypothetical protein [Chloroflexota bacterium]
MIHGVIELVESVEPVVPDALGVGVDATPEPMAAGDPEAPGDPDATASDGPGVTVVAAFV